MKQCQQDMSKRHCWWQYFNMSYIYAFFIYLTAVWAFENQHLEINRTQIPFPSTHNRWNEFLHAIERNWQPFHSTTSFPEDVSATSSVTPTVNRNVISPRFNGTIPRNAAESNPDFKTQRTPRAFTLSESEDEVTVPTRNSKSDDGKIDNTNLFSPSDEDSEPAGAFDTYFYQGQSPLGSSVSAQYGTFGTLNQDRLLRNENVNKRYQASYDPFHYQPSGNTRNHHTTFPSASLTVHHPGGRNYKYTVGIPAQTPQPFNPTYSTIGNSGHNNFQSGPPVSNGYSSSFPNRNEGRQNFPLSKVPNHVQQYFQSLSPGRHPQSSLQNHNQHQLKDSGNISNEKFVGNYNGFSTSSGRDSTESTEYTKNYRQKGHNDGLSKIPHNFRFESIFPSGPKENVYFANNEENRVPLKSLSATRELFNPAHHRVPKRPPSLLSELQYEHEENIHKLQKNEKQSQPTQVLNKPSQEAEAPVHSKTSFNTFRSSEQLENHRERERQKTERTRYLQKHGNRQQKLLNKFGNYGLRTTKPSHAPSNDHLYNNNGRVPVTTIDTDEVEYPQDDEFLSTVEESNEDFPSTAEYETSSEELQSPPNADISEEIPTDINKFQYEDDEENIHTTVVTLKPDSKHIYPQNHATKKESMNLETNQTVPTTGTANVDNADTPQAEVPVARKVPSSENKLNDLNDGRTESPGNSTSFPIYSEDEASIDDPSSSLPVYLTDDEANRDYSSSSIPVYPDDEVSEDYPSSSSPVTPNDNEKHIDTIVPTIPIQYETSSSGNETEDITEKSEDDENHKKNRPQFVYTLPPTYTLRNEFQIRRPSLLSKDKLQSSNRSSVSENRVLNTEKIDLKTLLRQVKPASLSELLQRRNLTLPDLLQVKQDAINALYNSITQTNENTSTETPVDSTEIPQSSFTTQAPQLRTLVPQQITTLQSSQTRNNKQLKPQTLKPSTTSIPNTDTQHTLQNPIFEKKDFVKHTNNATLRKTNKKSKNFVNETSYSNTDISVLSINNKTAENNSMNAPLLKSPSLNMKHMNLSKFLVASNMSLKDFAMSKKKEEISGITTLFQNIPISKISNESAISVFTLPGNHALSTSKPTITTTTRRSNRFNQFATNLHEVHYRNNEPNPTTEVPNKQSFQSIFAPTRRTEIDIFLKDDRDFIFPSSPTIPSPNKKQERGGIASAIVVSSIIGGFAVSIFLGLFMICWWRQKVRNRLSRFPLGQELQTSFGLPPLPQSKNIYSRVPHPEPSLWASLRGMT